MNIALPTPDSLSCNPLACAECGGTGLVRAYARGPEAVCDLDECAACRGTGDDPAAEARYYGVDDDEGYAALAGFVPGKF